MNEQSKKESADYLSVCWPERRIRRGNVQSCGRKHSVGSKEVVQSVKHDSAQTLSGRWSHGVSLSHCCTKCDINAQKFR